MPFRSTVAAQQRVFGAWQVMKHRQLLRATLEGIIVKPFLPPSTGEFNCVHSLVTEWVRVYSAIMNACCGPVVTQAEGWAFLLLISILKTSPEECVFYKIDWLCWSLVAQEYYFWNKAQTSQRLFVCFYYLILLLLKIHFVHSLWSALGISIILHW